MSDFKIILDPEWLQHEEQLKVETLDPEFLKGLKQIKRKDVPQYVGSILMQVEPYGSYIGPCEDAHGRNYHVSLIQKAEKISNRWEILLLDMVDGVEFNLTLKEFHEWWGDPIYLYE